MYRYGAVVHAPMHPAPIEGAGVDDNMANLPAAVGLGCVQVGIQLHPIVESTYS